MKKNIGKLKTKHSYSKPKIERIKLDKDISVFMVSPPGDPTFNGSTKIENLTFDPFKISNL